MRAHQDPTALNYSFYDIITATEMAPRRVRDLRTRCLNPGMYAQHLLRWLDYFPARQVLSLLGSGRQSITRSGIALV